MDTAQFPNLEQLPFTSTMQASMFIPPYLPTHPFKNVSNLKLPFGSLGDTIELYSFDGWIQIPSFCVHNMSIWSISLLFNQAYQNSISCILSTCPHPPIEMLQFKIRLPVGKDKIILFFCTLIHRPCLCLCMFCSRTGVALPKAFWKKLVVSSSINVFATERFSQSTDKKPAL